MFGNLFIKFIKKFKILGNKLIFKSLNKLVVLRKFITKFWHV